MSTYTNEQLMESYKKLPKDVQGAITSVDTADILRQIGDEKKMMIDKIGELAEETGLVLLGFTHPSQFVSHLAERLGIEKSVAKEIAEQVNSRIFFPVRENLKKIHGMREDETEEISKDGPGYPREIENPPPTSPSPTAPTPSPLPSALIPEPVVLETTIPVQPRPVEPETTAPPSPLTLPQPETTIPEIPAQPVTSIFEAKTKEEIFRQPMEVTEKKEEAKKIDPYREPTL